MAHEGPHAGPERQGWRLYAHPLFLDQLERLLATVERAKRSDPEGWHSKADARLLAALRSLVLDRVPRDPLAAEFRQGNTLGRERRHWFRAKFGGNRFRLFFRADSRARVIVYAWINDRDTLRSGGRDGPIRRVRADAESGQSARRLAYAAGRSAGDRSGAAPRDGPRRGSTPAPDQ